MAFETQITVIIIQMNTYVVIIDHQTNTYLSLSVHWYSSELDHQTNTYLSLSVHWYSSELDHSHIVWEVAGGINTKLKKGLASTKAAYGTYYKY